MRPVRLPLDPELVLVPVPEIEPELDTVTLYVPEYEAGSEEGKNGLGSNHRLFSAIVGRGQHSGLPEGSATDFP